MTGRVRLVSGCVRALELLTGVRKPDAGALMDAALRSTGLTHVALDDIAAPLGQFLRACEEEAQLSALGRWATKWDVHRLLKNLLRLRAEEALAPEILEQPVEAPIFITGTPRSGTTFLHRLMAEDPAGLAPRCWQTIYPYPDVGRRPGECDARLRRVEAQLRYFSILSPEMRNLHPIHGQSPQECTEITAHVFQSLRFEATYEIPSYRQWLEDHGHVQAYQFHKKFLQHLQSQGGCGRWVLKSPDHVFALDALQAVYPDARFVFVHRDPLKVIPSAARLTEVLRTPFTRRVDRVRIGHQVVNDWARGCAIMVEVDRRQLIPPARVLHLRYSDVVAHPLDAVARIYSHFGLPLTPGAVKKMSRLAGREPRGGYGRNHYRPEAYGIVPQQIRERFRDYVLRFGVPLEVDAAGGSPA
ncbi:MAG: sulfotransferase [Magnetospirillum sp.]|nr:sulfotransferase [Magnetospirillum sp.]